MTSEAKSDTNESTIGYLKYYCDPKNEHDYAVLLKGAWGSGKTFFIKKFLTDNKQKHLYVSLYGVGSAEQIDDELFRQMHPVLASKGMKIAAAAAKGLLKTTLKFDLNGDGKEDGSISSSLPDVDLRKFFDRPGESLLIFDDLERSSMKLTDALGYINAFVEHEGFKVIIVANEEEIIRKDDSYKNIKEKLVGKTFEVGSSTQSALSYFIGRIRDDKTRDFLILNNDYILSIYSASEIKNLRILKQSLWDFERVSAQFLEQHWSNKEASQRILGQIVSLSLEIRSGRVERTELDLFSTSKWVRSYKKEKDEKENKADLIEKRYSNVSFSFDILSRTMIEEIIFNGWLEPKKIIEELDKSPEYTPASIEPAWRTVWHSLERTEDQFYQALDSMESEFKNRSFNKSGEILHVFGIRLWLASAGVIKKNRKSVFRENKRYIDDIFRSGSIEKLPRDPFREEFRLQGFGGLGIHESQSVDYQELFAYLRSRREEATKADYPRQAAQLIEDMKNDQQLFYRKINLTNSKDNIYYDIPIMAHVNVDVFVDSLFRLNPHQRRIIFMSIKSRYEDGRIGRELSVERKWLEKLKKKLISHARKQKAITRHNILRQIEWNIDEFLK